jgi:hypothetical protein
MLRSAASCDRHFPNFLRSMIPPDKARRLRITRLETPDVHYRCECGVPAHWFALLVDSDLFRLR